MGLAGVGKSTVGEALSKKLRNQFGDTIWLDGDYLRNALEIEGHSRGTRINAGMKYLKLSSLLVCQSKFVILTSIGLQKPFEDYARQNFFRYFQVLIDGDVNSISHERSFYRRKTKDVMGVDISPDQLSFDFVLKNDRTSSIETLTLQLEKGLENWMKA
jgi:adenylylsulfate kinase-like enzyme